eukprot:TRINITY_DN6191_c0_g1_i2.p1 TRINITY_DN6191_c0_g1~~TRINITY_DN6191_c0_g1_i2.p1  ORF type:complete len:299 (-),score=6.05 TRINITY_DN6191_c0_g1_i2:554-1342(-)
MAIGDTDVYVCVDWSNVHIAVETLLAVVVRRRHVRFISVCGSAAGPCAASTLNSEWKLAFPASPGRDVLIDFQVLEGRERCVDDRLVAAVAVAILQGVKARKRLVLVTGDGDTNNNGHSTGAGSFYGLAAAVVSNGWHLEVWSLEKSCSRRYSSLLAEYPHLVTLHSPNKRRECGFSETCHESPLMGSDFCLTHKCGRQNCCEAVRLDPTSNVKWRFCDAHLGRCCMGNCRRSRASIFLLSTPTVRKGGMSPSQGDHRRQRR